ncbi:MAG: hypothetical protein ACJA1L_003498 [Paracoccaceae bacterium]|jgi:hypothetical protein
MQRTATAIALALALAPTLTPSARAADPVPTAAGAIGPDDHAQTCRHFSTRARLRDRGVAPDFLVTAAEACAQALTDDAPAARAVLVRLTRLRLTIWRMNLARAYGADTGPAAMPIVDPGGVPRQGGWVGPPVSATGEYLIAREMGVPTALARWRADHRRQSLASR